VSSQVLKDTRKTAFVTLIIFCFVLEAQSQKRRDYLSFPEAFAKNNRQFKHKMKEKMM
jgi:hypothetical protein